MAIDLYDSIDLLEDVALLLGVHADRRSRSR